MATQPFSSSQDHILRKLNYSGFLFLQQPSSVYVILPSECIFFPVKKSQSEQNFQCGEVTVSIKKDPRHDTFMTYLVF